MPIATIAPATPASVRASPNCRPRITKTRYVTIAAITSETIATRPRAR